MRIELRVRGQLGERRARQFEGFEMTWTEAGDSILTGEVSDQSALYGLIRRVQSLGMQLISINEIDRGENESNLS